MGTERSRREGAADRGSLDGRGAGGSGTGSGFGAAPAVCLWRVRTCGGRGEGLQRWAGDEVGSVPRSGCLCAISVPCSVHLFPRSFSRENLCSRHLGASSGQRPRSMVFPTDCVTRCFWRDAGCLCRLHGGLAPRGADVAALLLSARPGRRLALPALQAATAREHHAEPVDAARRAHRPPQEVPAGEGPRALGGFPRPAAELPPPCRRHVCPCVWGPALSFPRAECEHPLPPKILNIPVRSIESVLPSRGLAFCL